MQYSPKLKKAMEEIKAIIDKNDIAGLVILHTPGHSEYFTKLNPSYSCATHANDNLRVKAKLQEDFGGDKEAWTKKLTDTVNMFEHFTEVGATVMYPIMEIRERLEKHIDIESTGGGHSSHTTQNN